MPGGSLVDGKPAFLHLYEHQQHILYPNPRQVRQWQQSRDFPQLEGLRSRLLSVPGVGEKSVNVLVALILRWAQLGRQDVKGLVAYLGLDPCIRQSGKQAPRGHISKQEPPRWRSLPVAAARGGLRQVQSSIARESSPPPPLGC